MGVFKNYLSAKDISDLQRYVDKRDKQNILILLYEIVKANNPDVRQETINSMFEGYFSNGVNPSKMPGDPSDFSNYFNGLIDGALKISKL